jgi:hypothetical protein
MCTLTDNMPCCVVSSAQDDEALNAIRPNASHVAFLARIFRCDRMVPE